MKTSAILAPQPFPLVGGENQAIQERQQLPEARRLGASRHAACVEAHSPTPDLHELLEIAALMRRSARVVLLLLVPTSTASLYTTDPSLITYPTALALAL